tara:strand:- start:1836 stop:2144 length:309 start_codon:yes stop_codon:yes gene_type:complete
MPKFKITYYKDVLYKAESIIEAEDREKAESMADDIPLDKFNDLDWENAEYEEPNWDATFIQYAEEIRDRDKEAEQEYWDLHPEEELKHKMNLKSYFNAKGGD